MRTRRCCQILILAFFALVGVAVLFYCTRWGIGLGSDSFYYISGANNLQDGLGYSRPSGDGSVRLITHFPPVYSFFITALSLVGLDTMEAARWLNALLFGANIFVIGLTLHRFSASLWIALAGAFATLSSPVMLSVHSWALSEPLFLLFVLLALWTLGSYLEGRRRLHLLVASAFAALAYLVRYVGSTVIMTGAVVMLLPFGLNWRKRATSLTLFLGTSLLGPCLWLLRNVLVAGSATNRVIGWHPITLQQVGEGLNTFSLWLLPSRVPEILRCGIAILVALSLLVLSVRIFFTARARCGGGDDKTSTLPAHASVVTIFAIIYLTFLVLSISFLDASTPLDGRILSPLYLAGLLLVLYLFHLLLISKVRGRWSKIVFLALLLGFMMFTAVRGGRLALNLHANGQGFASREWRDSEVVKWVETLPEGLPIYTNEMDGLYLLTGRAAYQIPIKWDPVRATPRTDYEEQMMAMRARIWSERGVLVLFHTLARQQVIFPSEEELTKGLDPILRSNDGVIFGTH